jgi:hypothetical protein
LTLFGTSRLSIFLGINGTQVIGVYREDPSWEENLFARLILFSDDDPLFILPDRDVQSDPIQLVHLLCVILIEEAR